MADFCRSFCAADGLPHYSAAAGQGFVTGETRLADAALQIRETGPNLEPYWWNDTAPVADVAAAPAGVVAVPTAAARPDELAGRALPLWYRADVPAEGVYRAVATLTGTDPGGEVLVFAQRRRLAWRGTLAPGQTVTVEALCDVTPIIPRGQTEPAPTTAVDLVVFGPAALAGVTVAAAPGARRVWVLGDSTVTDQTAAVPYAPGASYAGWGQMLPWFLPAGWCVSNHAHSGLTGESFTTEGHWAIVAPRLRPGDACLMQFGHNDQKLAHLQAAGGYTDWLRRYVQAVRAQGAQPVLVTPLARNSWANGGQEYNDLLRDFAAAVHALAGAEGVPVIDLHAHAMALLKREGREQARRWFYPGDYTHTNDFGAYNMAAFVGGALAPLLGSQPAPARAPWPPVPAAVPQPPAGCTLEPPAGSDPLAPYEAERPQDPLTRVEALALVIAALRFFPINIYNDLYNDVVGHEPYAGTVQCAAQNHLIPPELTADGCLHPQQSVTLAEFLAILMPGYAARREVPCAALPTALPEFARLPAAQALGAGLVPPNAPWAAPLPRAAAAAVCRKLRL